MKSWALAMCLAQVAVAASAAEIAGVTLEERTTLGTSELVLNGAGLRKKLFLRVYVAGLYLTQKRSSPAEVLALTGPKRISITLLRTLPTRKLVDALKGGIRDNSSPEEEHAVAARVEALAANLLELGQGKEGDVITFDWRPEAGTFVALNGDLRGEAIPGDDLYRALLRIWLGEHPTSAGLKRALLGQTD